MSDKRRRAVLKRRARNSARRETLRLREGNLTMAELWRMMERTDQLSGRQMSHHRKLFFLAVVILVFMVLGLIGRAGNHQDQLAYLARLFGVGWGLGTVTRLAYLWARPRCK